MTEIGIASIRIQVIRRHAGILRYLLGIGQLFLIVEVIPWRTHYVTCLRNEIGIGDNVLLLRELAHLEIVVVVDNRLFGSTHFRSYQNHAIGSTRTVDGTGGGIFQYGDLRNVVGIQCIQRGIV